MERVWERCSGDQCDPYRSSPRVFVIVDNGSAQREKRSIQRTATTVRGTEPSPG